MDPKVTATILTILLYIFSGNNPKPENAAAPSTVPAYEVSAAVETETKKPVIAEDNPIGSVKELSRVRKGPGTEFPILRRLPAGTKVTVLAWHNEWYPNQAF